MKLYTVHCGFYDSEVVDGMQEIQAVEGYRLSFKEDKSLNGATLTVGNKHRELAPIKETL